MDRQFVLLPIRRSLKLRHQIAGVVFHGHEAGAHFEIRSHFIQSVLKYKFNSHVSGHLWGGCLFPGDFYAHTDPMPFLRAEVVFTL